MLAGLERDPAYRELYDSFRNGRSELERVNRLSNRNLRRVLINNMKKSMFDQRNLIGGYVKMNLSNKLRLVQKAFEGMSYIRLEILSRRKNELYNFDDKEDGESKKR